MSININPSGKIQFVYPVDHYQNNSDPHTETLNQTNLIVYGVLSGNEIQFDEMILSGTAVVRHMDYTNIVGDRLEINPASEFVSDLTTTIFSGLRATISGSSTWVASVGAAPTITIDGRDVSVDGLTLDGHVADVANPHQLSVDQISGVPNDADSLYEGNLEVQSGRTIDGVDISTLEKFIDDSLIPNTLHYHKRNYKTANLKQQLAPEFGSVVFSGNDYSVFQSDWDNTHNCYVFSGTEANDTTNILHQIPMSSYLAEINSINFWYNGGVDSRIETTIFDSLGNIVEMNGGNVTGNGSWVQESITNIGAISSGTNILMRNTLKTFSGTEIKLGEFIIDYDEVQHE